MSPELGYFHVPNQQGQSDVLFCAVAGSGEFAIERVAEKEILRDCVSDIAASRA